MINEEPTIEEESSLIEKAQANVYYEHQRLSAILEEEKYESYMPPTPKVPQPPKVKFSTGMYNFITHIIKQLPC